MLRRVDRALGAILNAAILVAAIALIFLMVLQVLGRYVLKAPFIGAEELLGLSAVWVYFTGMAAATRKRAHIGGGILGELTGSPVIHAAVRILVAVVSLLVVSAYAWFALSYTIDTALIGRASPFLRWPMWIWSASMVASFLASVVYLLRDLILGIKSFAGLRRIALAHASFEGDS